MSQEDAAPAPEKVAVEATETKVEVKPQDGDTFNAEYVKTLRTESAQRRVENQQLKERLEELEERDKSELEKAQAKAQKLEQAKADAEAKLIRFEVANDKGLPKELVPRLQGSTREELEADAEELLTLVKSRTDSNNEPDFDGGAREPAPDPKTPEEQHNNEVLKLLGLTT